MVSNYTYLSRIAETLNSRAFNIIHDNDGNGLFKIGMYVDVLTTINNRIFKPIIPSKFEELGNIISSINEFKSIKPDRCIKLCKLLHNDMLILIQSMKISIGHDHEKWLHTITNTNVTKKYRTDILAASGSHEVMARMWELCQANVPYLSYWAVFGLGSDPHNLPVFTYLMTPPNEMTAKLHGTSLNNLIFNYSTRLDEKYVTSSFWETSQLSMVAMDDFMSVTYMKMMEEMDNMTID